MVQALDERSRIDQEETAPPVHAHRLLIVEDEAIIATDIQRRLQRMGYTAPLTVFCGEDAVRLARENQPDLVLMDIRLQDGMDGVEAAHQIRRELDIPVVFLTALTDSQTVHRARDVHPFGYLTKPFDDRELDACIELAVYRHKAEREVRRLQQWLKATLRCIGDAVVATDAAGRVTLLNPVAEKLLGWSESEAVGRDFGEIFHAVDELARRPIANPVQKALREGKALSLNQDVILISKYGAQTPVSDSAAPIRDGDENIIGAVLVFRDNTQNKRAAAQIKQLNSQLEQRVRERTAQLEAANKELEAFSYSVSHDLRAPLRHIDGFADLLAQHKGTSLDDTGRRYLKNISDSAKHLGALIDNLLSFCRTGRTGMSRAPVNMNELVREVLQEMERETQGRSIAWDIGELAEVSGDRVMLKQVWVNLLSNAIKYTRQRARAEIKVGCEVQGGQVEFFVRDNGAGFDMVFAGKLFGVFQRLHHAAEFEGTGIGLANVRRIVARHGGNAWGEGKVGVGATFYFTLPVAANQ
jgi:PAS domain S-box-containing protein